ncbi:MAG TPA: SNF2 helicase associated domain-containing protein, partial [Chitinophagaceae bacterium]|nr:SNF2 helicase associated domain-containing protein [Chitinophagaceae bacterium]
FAKVHLFTERHGTRWPIRSNRLKNPLLFLFDQELVLIHKPSDALRLFEWGDDQVIKANEWEEVLNQKLLPLCRFYDVQFDQELVENRYEAEPLLKIYLSEQGSYFILKPVFVYGGTEAAWNEEASVSSLEDGKLVIIHRNKPKEEAYIQELQQLHPHLRVHETGHQLMLHSKYALQKNWFFLFFEKMKERNIELLGHSDLRQFRIHPSKPSTHLHVSSNLDWFDTAIEVDFDGQKARLQDIQKALATKQNYVPLSDGSLGLLPEEWLQKFSLLFKMGEYHQNQIRVNKFNFSIIDSLYDMIDDEALKLELKEKSDILLQANPGRFEEVPIPSEVKAVLRPYQEAGFRWL